MANFCKLYKFQNQKIKKVEKEEKMINQHNEIAKIFAYHYAKISRDPYIKSKPKKYRRRKKQDNQPYDEPFTEREVKAVIKQQKNTAPGEDTIHPQVKIIILNFISKKNYNLFLQLQYMTKKQLTN